MTTENTLQPELHEAAASTLEELTHLATTLPSKIAVMLLYIRDHLFDRELSVGVVKEKCGVRDNSVAIHFHAVVGDPPAAFITRKRLAVADRLLSETYLPIWKISDLLGYSSIQVFGRAYQRCKGIRPLKFRRQFLSDLPPKSKAGSAPLPAEPPEVLARALAGQLGSEEATRLIRRLLELYPPGRRLAPAPNY